MCCAKKGLTSLVGSAWTCGPRRLVTKVLLFAHCTRVTVYFAAPDKLAVALLFHVGHDGLVSAATAQKFARVESVTFGVTLAADSSKHAGTAQGMLN